MAGMRRRQTLALGGAGFLAGLLAIARPAPAADPVLAAAGDIACAPESADFNGSLGTETACRMSATTSKRGWCC